MDHTSNNLSSDSPARSEPTPIVPLDRVILDDSLAAPAEPIAPRKFTVAADPPRRWWLRRRIRGLAELRFLVVGRLAWEFEVERRSWLSRSPCVFASWSTACGSSRSPRGSEVPGQAAS